MKLPAQRAGHLACLKKISSPFEGEDEGEGEGSFSPLSLSLSLRGEETKKDAIPPRAKHGAFRHVFVTGIQRNLNFKKRKMVEIKDLTLTNGWDVAGFCFNRPKREKTYSEGDEERYKEARERKKIYLEKMLKQGARAKIAYEDQNAVGFIEYYPIEIVNLEIVGKDIMAIWCMNVKEKGKGIGGRLIEGCLQDSEKLGRKGVAVTCWDPIWMPKKIFEKYGFMEVGKAVGNGVVLFKKFREVENPVWIGRGRNYETQLRKDGVVIDLFHSDRCPIHWRNTTLLKKIIKEFSDTVVLNEYNVDQRENMLKHKIEYSIYLNGTAIGAGPPIDEDEVRRKIAKELKKLN